MGTSKAQASGYGTAAGTAIGSIWGPAGAAVGGALGGAVGGMLGSDPKAPPPVDLPPPQLPGGVSNQYNGWTVDPVTGRVVYYDNTANGGMTADQYRNMQLKDMMLGGNSAGQDLQSQIAQVQQLIARLQGQGPGGTSGPKASDFLPKEWTNEDGTPKKPGEIDYQSELANRSGLFKAFEAQVGGKGYGKGSTLEQFKAWVQDAYRNNIQAKVTQYENAQKTATGNAQTSGEGLQAAQTRLQTLMGLQQGGGPNANNPIMNFLNQRNMTSGNPDYEAQFKDKYNDPFIGKMAGEADYYLGKSHDNINFADLASQLGMGADPGIPDAKKFTADMLSQYGGAMGGERMAPIGEYDSSKLGSWLAGQNRVAENQSASAMRSADDLASKRGLLGSSVNDSSRLNAEMALQDRLAGNAAQTYSMDAADRNNWFNQKFAVDQHNSDVARLGAQGKASLASQGFGNEMAAKQLYEQILGNRFGMNTSEQQRAVQNMLATLNQRTALDQRRIDNTRYDVSQQQGLDRQNYLDRMGLLGYLSQSQGQNFNQTMGQQQMGQSQNQLGAQIGLTTTGWNNDYNIANAAQQNAYNMGQFNQGQAQHAQDMNNWNTMAGALGQYGSSLWGSNGTPSYDRTGTGNFMASINSAPSTARPMNTPPAGLTNGSSSSWMMPQEPTPPVYSLAKPPTYGK